MQFDGITIEERFGQTTHDLLFMILKELKAIRNCSCGGGDPNVIRMPIYNTYDLPAGSTLISVEFPSYGSIPGDVFTYHAMLGETFGGNELADENILTGSPVIVTLNQLYPLVQTLYFQNNLAAYDSSQAVAWLTIRIP